MDVTISKGAVNNTRRNAVNAFFPTGRLAGIWTAEAWDKVEVTEDAVIIHGKVSRRIPGGSAKLIGGSRP